MELFVTGQKCVPIQALIRQKRLRCIGHLSRVHDSGIEKSILYGELAQGSRKHGGQKLIYKGILRETLKTVNVNADWDNLSLDRATRRGVEHENNGPRTQNRHSPATGHFPCP